MSSRTRWLVPALIALIGVGTELDVRAEKVDWSQYVEAPGTKFPAQTHAKPAADPPAARAKQATKRQPAASNKPRARAKPARKH